MAEANVKNIEALELFLDAIVSLRSGTRKQADEIRQQLQRVSNWLEKELPDYWRNEQRIAENKFIEARAELMRCESKTRAEDERSCFVQKKMLAKAKERKALCEHPLEFPAPYLCLNHDTMQSNCDWLYHTMICR